MRTRLSLLALLLLGLTFLPLSDALPVSAQGTHDWLVTSDADSGTGTLRWAIEAANQSDGSDRIAFARAMTIRPHSALPPLDDRGISIVANSNGDVSVDDEPTIWLDGASAGDAAGLEVLSSDAEIVGLGIVGFERYGIGVIGAEATDAVIRGNWIGLQTDGSVSANRLSGIAILAGASQVEIRNNRIGGNSSQRRTGHGIVVGGGDTQGVSIQGNVIGIAPDGSPAPNDDGILIVDSAHASVRDNTIGHSKVAGIELRETRTSIELLHNWIGIARDGSAAANNIGVFLGPASAGATIGGDLAGNVIAGNRVGIAVEQGAREAIITGNWIGLVPHVPIDQELPLADTWRQLSGYELVLARSVPNRERGISIILGAAQIQVRGNQISAGDFGVVVDHEETSQISLTANAIAGSRSTRTEATIDIRAGTEINVGGGEPALGNHICGAEYGVRVAQTEQPRVEHNAIGGNAAVGVRFDSDNQMDWGVRLNNGVREARVQHNLIAGASRAAISVVGGDSQDNRLSLNTYGANGIDIDLGADGPTANDERDRDRGPNGLLNHPVITDHQARSRGSGRFSSIFSGTATPRSRVEIYEWRATSARLIARSQPANSRGEWEARTAELPPEPVLIRALTVSQRGATSEFSPVFVPTQRVKLSPGTHQIAWTGPNTPIDQAMSTLQRWLRTVWRWDAESQRWQGWSPLAPGSAISELRFGDVLQVTLAGRFAIDYLIPAGGSLETPGWVSLRAGHNNVVWTGGRADAASVMEQWEAQQPDLIERIWQWDQDEGQWRPVWPESERDEDASTRWEDTLLWIQASADGVLLPP